MNDLNTLTRRQLLIKIVDLQKIDNLINTLREKTLDKDYSIVLVCDNPNSFVHGKIDDICNMLFHLIETLVKETGLQFDVILKQILEQRKDAGHKIIKDDRPINEDNPHYIRVPGK